jgi:hypothetical protein
MKVSRVLGRSRKTKGKQRRSVLVGCRLGNVVRHRAFSRQSTPKEATNRGCGVSFQRWSIKSQRGTGKPLSKFEGLRNQRTSVPTSTSTCGVLKCREAILRREIVVAIASWMLVSAVVCPISSANDYGQKTPPALHSFARLFGGGKSAIRSTKF